ncbi:hypothetical protein Tco_1291716 [Tanacetum coccineum]
MSNIPYVEPCSATSSKNGKNFELPSILEPGKLAKVDKDAILVDANGSLLSQIGSDGSNKEPDGVTEKSLKSHYGSRECKDFTSLTQTWLGRLKVDS